MFDYKMYVELGNTMQRKIEEAKAAITVAEDEMAVVDTELAEAITKKEQVDALVRQINVKKAELKALIAAKKQAEREAEEEFIRTVLMPANRVLSKHGGDRRSKNFNGTSDIEGDPLKTWAGFCEDIGMTKRTANRKIKGLLGMDLKTWDIKQYFSHARYLVEEQGMDRPQAKAALEEYIEQELIGFDNSASTYEYKMFPVIESEHTDLKDKVAAGELPITTAYDIYLERKSGGKKDRAKKREADKKKKEREAKKAAKEKAKAEEREAKAALRKKHKGVTALVKKASSADKHFTRFVDALVNDPDIKHIIFDGVKANGGDITEKQAENLAQNLLDVVTDLFNSGDPKKMDRAFKMRAVLVDDLQSKISWLSVVFYAVHLAFKGVCEIDLNANFTGAQPTKGAETLGIGADYGT